MVNFAERPCTRSGQAVAAMRAGRPVVVVADERGTETAGLVFAAQLVTPSLVGFAVRHTSGVVCVALTGPRLADLGLAVLTTPASIASGLPYTVTADLANGSTGISARDRAATIAALADPSRSRREFSLPGHVVPVLAHPDGLAARRGLAETGVSLAHGARLGASAGFAHLVSTEEPGGLADGEEGRRFAAGHGLVVVHVDALGEALDGRFRVPA